MGHTVVLILGGVALAALALGVFLETDTSMVLGTGVAIVCTVLGLVVLLWTDRPWPNRGERR